MKNTPFIDIFCRVIDHYGDIGVCWRFAKDFHHILNTIYTYNKHNTHIQFSSNSLFHQLFQASIHLPHPVRLWVDDLVSFAKIEPELTALLPSISNKPATVDSNPFQTYIKGIQIIHWTPHTVQQLLHNKQQAFYPAPIVIEAFGTNLDDNFTQAMRGHTHYWFNLEYLSAENWVESFHGKASPQKNGVPKYFFFPGFSPKTGGLIREVDLMHRLNHFSPDNKAQWLSHYIHPSTAQAYSTGARLIHLFCYPSAPFASLVEALCEVYTKDHRPTLLLLAESILPDAEQVLADYIAQTKADIRLQRFSFIPQEQFDYLLNIADFNIIRGEDSFVRAIWSGKPFLWHIYEQQDDIHFEKLNAWLNSCPRPHPLAQLQYDWNHYAAWNNPLIKPAPIKEAEKAKAMLHQQLVPQWTSFFSLSWQEIQDFHSYYRECLLKNPTLSFSMLNFQAKQS